MLRYLMLLIMLAPVFAVAQGEDLVMEVRTAYDGFYKPGAWTPVVVTLDNRAMIGDASADFVGQLMVTPNAYDGSPARFSTDVEVPATSRKRYVVHARFASPSAGTPPQQHVFLTLPNGKRVSSTALDLTPLDEDQLLIVTVGNALHRPMMPVFGLGLDRVVYTRISPNDLPDSALAWQSVDVVIMDGWPDAGLSARGTSALEQWVAGGGTLVMLGGQHGATYTGGAARQLLPVAYEGTGLLVEAGDSLRYHEEETAADLPEGRKHAVARVAPRPDATTLLDLAGVPLVVYRDVGLGRVVYFANDFRSSSRALDDLLRPAWNALAPLPSLASGATSSHRYVERFKSLTGKAARAPNPLLVSLVCILYVVIVGPINFLYLQKKGRLEWAWFTLPVIVFVFFFFSYAVGQMTKGNIRLYRELAVETYRAGDSRGSAVALLNTFTSNPVNARITPLREGAALGDSWQWAGSPGFLDVLTLGLPLSAQAARSGGGANFLHDAERDRVGVSSWPMATFEAQAFMLRGAAEMAGVVDSAVVWGPGGLSGSVTNNSGADFSDSFLMIGREAMRIGPLANGESYTIAGQPAGFITGRSGWHRLPTMLTQNGWFSANPIPEDGAEVSLHNAAQWLVSESAPEGTGEMFPPHAGKLRFVGFRHRDAIQEASTNLSPDEWSSAAVTVVDLAPKAARGRVVFPGEYVQLRVHSAKVDAITGKLDFDKSSRLNMASSTLVFSAELPVLDRDLRVTRIRLSSNADTPAQYTTNYELYDYVERVWVKVTPEAEVQNRNFAMPYNGRLMGRIRVVAVDASAQSYWYNVGIRSLVLAMEAEVSAGSI